MSVIQPATQTPWLTPPSDREQVGPLESLGALPSPHPTQMRAKSLYNWFLYVWIINPGSFFEDSEQLCDIRVTFGLSCLTLSPVCYSNKIRTCVCYLRSDCIRNRPMSRWLFQWETASTLILCPQWVPWNITPSLVSFIVFWINNVVPGQRGWSGCILCLWTHCFL